MHLLHAVLIFVFVLGAAPAAQQSSFAPAESADANPLVLSLEYENSDIQPEHETATLRIQVPAGNLEYREDRRCMTVCSRWGEDCLRRSAGSGAVATKCVRTCKSFAEECL